MAGSCALNAALKSGGNSPRALAASCCMPKDGFWRAVCTIASIVAATVMLPLAIVLAICSVTLRRIPPEMVAVGLVYTSICTGVIVLAAEVMTRLRLNSGGTMMAAAYSPRSTAARALSALSSATALVSVNSAFSSSAAGCASAGGTSAEGKASPSRSSCPPCSTPSSRLTTATGISRTGTSEPRMAPLNARPMMVASASGVTIMMSSRLRSVYVRYRSFHAMARICRMISRPRTH